MFWISISILVSLLLLELARRRSYFRLFKKLGIPGPEPSLISGNLFEFAKLGARKALLQWNRFGETYGYFYGVQPIIVTSNAELLHKIIFKDANLFYNRAFQFVVDTPHSIAGRQVHVTRNSAEIKAFRTQFTSSFTSNKLKQVVNTAEESAQLFLSVLKETASPGKDFEMSKPLRLLAMDAVGRTSFGMAFDLQRSKQIPLVMQQAEECVEKSLNTFINAVAVCIPHAITQPVLKALYSAKLLVNGIDDLAKTIGAIVDVRKKNFIQRNDILENLLHKKVLGRSMTRDEVNANAAVAFFAGFDTTAVTLALVVFRLGQQANWQKTIREEIFEEWDDSDLYESLGKLKKLDRFINETLRLDPPAPAFITREAAEDYVHGDLLIPKGTAVQAPLPILHRDPNIFPNPDEFNPDHFLGNIPSVYFMPFGEGPRNCVGMRFALLQVKLAIVRLVQNYRLRLGDDVKSLDELPQKDYGILRKPEEFHMKLEPISV